MKGDCRDKTYTSNEIIAKLLPVFKAHPIEKALLVHTQKAIRGLSDIDIMIDSKVEFADLDFFGVRGYHHSA